MVNTRYQVLTWEYNGNPLLQKTDGCMWVWRYSGNSLTKALCKVVMLWRKGYSRIRLECQ